MKLHNNKKLYELRKELRQNATPHEVALWNCIRGRKTGYKIKRQHSIGPYIVDFYCAQKKLIIELYGAAHLHVKKDDAGRVEFFRNMGYKVLIIWNSEIEKSIDKVIEKIIKQW